MSNALRTRQQLFALALPLAAALYIGAEGLDPKGTDQIVTTTAIACGRCCRSPRVTLHSCTPRGHSR